MKNIIILFIMDGAFHFAFEHRYTHIRDCIAYLLSGVFSTKHTHKHSAHLWKPSSSSSSLSQVLSLITTDE